MDQLYTVCHLWQPLGVELSHRRQLCRHLRQPNLGVGLRVDCPHLLGAILLGGSFLHCTVTQWWCCWYMCPAFPLHAFRPGSCSLPACCSLPLLAASEAHARCTSPAMASSTPLSTLLSRLGTASYPPPPLLNPPRAAANCGALTAHVCRCCYHRLGTPSAAQRSLRVGLLNSVPEGPARASSFDGVTSSPQLASSVDREGSFIRDSQGFEAQYERVCVVGCARLNRHSHWVPTAPAPLSPVAVEATWALATPGMARATPKEARPTSLAPCPCGELPFPQALQASTLPAPSTWVARPVAAAPHALHRGLALQMLQVDE